MLKLVLGGSGSGKTTLLYARIRARAEQGLRSILLVPEQFTSSTEGRIYRELGDALSGMVESFSFTSLAEHILSAEGGAAVQTLSDAGRAVLVRRALEELQDNVHYYYRHRRSAAFCQMAAETIDELKSAGLSGQQLYTLAQDCGPESAKLCELAMIFQGYETLLAGTGNKRIRSSVRSPLKIRFGIVCSLEEIVDGDIEIIGKFNERLVVGLTRSGLVPADAVLIHVKIHRKLELRYSALFAQCFQSHCNPSS